MAFAKIPDRLIARIHLLSKNELVVYIYLLKCMNAETKRCDPRQATIARATNLPTSRVCEAVRGLKRNGWAIADEFGNFSLPENVTESVTPTITESVMKRYGKRKERQPKTFRKAALDVTESVSRSLKGIEKTKEKIANAESEQSDHKKAMAFLADQIGPYPDGGAQGKAAKWILEHFTMLDIRKHLPGHVAEYRAKGLHPSFLTLQKVIGDLKAADAPPITAMPTYCERCRDGKGYFYVDDIAHKCDHRELLQEVVANGSGRRV